MPEGTIPDLIIARADQGDGDDLRALAVETYVEAFGHSFSPADLAAQLEQNLSLAKLQRAVEDDVILLARAAGRLVGFVQFGALRLPVSPQADHAHELRRLYVQAGFRNRGVGARLMAAALAEMERHGPAEVYLDVWDQNHGARRFYARHGFEVIGELPFTVASGAATTPDLIMARRHLG